MPDNIFLVLLIFGGSLYALMKGADWLTDGSSQIAKFFKVSDLIIGLTVVAFGTSLPELVVSVQSALQGSGELAYANVIGSNIANTLLILGTSSVVIPLVTTPEVRKDLPYVFILTIAFVAIVLLNHIDSPSSFLFAVELYWQAGVVLLLFFIIFIIRIFLNNKEELADEVEPGEASFGKSILLVVVGLALVILGGELTVSSAIRIAERVGVPEETIGLTIVAFGTSLPELVASLTMAGKNKGEMIIGNIIGSNIMNLTLVLGTATALSPVKITHWGVLDMLVLTAVSFLFLALMMRKTTKGNLNRNTGMLFLLLYLSYIIAIGYRGASIATG